MKPEERLLTTLKGIVENLSSGSQGIASEGDYPFQAFACDAADEENFTITQRLSEENLIRPVELDDFIQGWQCKLLNHPLPQVTQKYQELVQLIQAYLTNLQAYALLVGSENPVDKISPSNRPFMLIIGKTQDGDWVGLAPGLTRPDAVEYRRRLRRNIKSPGQIALKLEAKLQQILANLPEPKKIVWKVAQTKALVIETLLESANYLATYEFQGINEELCQFSKIQINFEKGMDSASTTSVTIEDEYKEYEEEEWDDEEDFEVEHEYKSLEKFLFANIQNSRIYVVGSGANSRFYLYFVGQTLEGDWLGASTIAIWT